MSRTLLAFFASTLLCSTVYAHCQVPCGIYGDQLRFEQMLEDTKTITKAQGGQLYHHLMKYFGRIIKMNKMHHFILLDTV